MSKQREELIRATFELARNLEWVESLEPKFRDHDISAAELAKSREAWNEHTERRDWEWWKDQSKGMSISELDDERIGYTQKLNALGMLQTKRENIASPQNQFQEILKGTLKSEDKPQEQSKDQGRDM